ncbi:MAG: 1-deoxy-D-xylulose-5-phosphate reductoisomerase [Syntrophales bacterium]|nr:1-deoxy-D-xylulose-5-phosphate reductoisomerase [Syntrophales bacterium]
MKKLSILGSTGSIGVNSLDVVSQNKMQCCVVGLAAGRNIDLLKIQIEQFRPLVAAVMDETHAVRLKKLLSPDCRTEILWGPEGYREVARVPEAEMVISAMVGSAGLVPTLEALDAGKHIALANKETLVTAGHLIIEKAREKNVRILPVDSEHSAVFQCLSGQREQDVRRIILTASGGPFRTFSRAQLDQVTPADALKHPNWEMGRKITIDSASMMNKGLEIIEAKWLFGLDIDRIDVLVHPQSVIHSMVEFVDGSVMAQLGIPDMRIPIAYALSFPSRMPNQGVFLDFLRATPLEFFEPDPGRFPCLKLAIDAGRAGGTLPVVLNGANETAVEAFLQEKIKFTQLPVVISEALSRHRWLSSPGLEEILEADRWSRQEADNIIKEISH